MKDQIPRIDDNSSLIPSDQSYWHNMNFIFGALSKDKTLIDERSYHVLLAHQQTDDLIEQGRIIGSLLQHFAENGYYFDLFSQVENRDPFVEGELRTVKLSKFSGIEKIFPIDLSKK